MKWFAAHAVVAMRRIDSEGPISAYENIFLVQAENADQARNLATDMAKAEVEIDDGLTIGGVAAKRTLAGIRKVITISNPSPLDLDEDQPISGTEITYSEFEVASEEDLRKLAAGEGVLVHYVD
jgi:hypothetical protein